MARGVTLAGNNFSLRVNIPEDSGGLTSNLSDDQVAAALSARRAGKNIIIAGMRGTRALAAESISGERANALFDYMIANDLPGTLDGFGAAQVPSGAFLPSRGFGEALMATGAGLMFGAIAGGSLLAGMSSGSAAAAATTTESFSASAAAASEASGYSMIGAAESAAATAGSSSAFSASVAAASEASGYSMLTAATQATGGVLEAINAIRNNPLVNAASTARDVIGAAQNVNQAVEARRDAARVAELSALYQQEAASMNADAAQLETMRAELSALGADVPPPATSSAELWIGAALLAGLLFL